MDEVNDRLEVFKSLVENLSIEEDQKVAFRKEMRTVQKILETTEFKYKRTVIDKLAITNVLNASIQEIEKQKKIIEETKNQINQTLTELDAKNKLVEEKNIELNEVLTHLKETQQQLVQSEKMASLGQLTAGVAHEINNPINFVSANIKPLSDDLHDILNCIQFFKKHIKANNLESYFPCEDNCTDDTEIQLLVDEINSLLKGMKEGASRTSEIVKGLRNFSRLDQDIAKTANLNEGLDSTLTLLHSTYKDHIEIIRDYGIIPDIDCFPGQLNQVFMNLLSNAIQAIPGDGKIFIKTTATDEEVTISIKDTGKGIPKNVISKIFDPFFTTKDVGKGTGLGLSISFGIIQKHNGRIEVKSVPDEGTTFNIFLPINQSFNT